MFLVTSALIIMPEQAAVLLKEDPQKCLPTLVLEKMPFVMQVLFFGALLSAIKSTASATLLAPSVTFVENIWRQFKPHMSDKEELRTMRITVLVFSASVLVYAIRAQGTPIYEMVSGAYQVTLVGAFIPLVFGLYWKRATTQGALFSIVLGLLTWVLFLATPAGLEFPAQLAGDSGGATWDAYGFARTASDQEHPRQPPQTARCCLMAVPDEANAHHPSRWLAYGSLALSMTLVGSYVALSKPLVAALACFCWPGCGLASAASPWRTGSNAPERGPMTAQPNGWCSWSRFSAISCFPSPCCLVSA
jgi:hypothetical protein